MNTKKHKQLNPEDKGLLNATQQKKYNTPFLTDNVKQFVKKYDTITSETIPSAMLRFKRSIEERNKDFNTNFCLEKVAGDYQTLLYPFIDFAVIDTNADEAVQAIGNEDVNPKLLQAQPIIERYKKTLSKEMGFSESQKERFEDISKQFEARPTAFRLSSGIRNFKSKSPYRMSEYRNITNSETEDGWWAFGFSGSYFPAIGASEAVSEPQLVKGRTKKKWDNSGRVIGADNRYDWDIQALKDYGNWLLHYSYEKHGKFETIYHIANPLFNSSYGILFHRYNDNEYEYQDLYLYPIQSGCKVQDYDYDKMDNSNTAIANPLKDLKKLSSIAPSCRNKALSNSLETIKKKLQPVSYDLFNDIRDRFINNPEYRSSLCYKVRLHHPATTISISGEDVTIPEHYSYNYIPVTKKREKDILEEVDKWKAKQLRQAEDTAKARKRNPHLDKIENIGLCIQQEHLKWTTDDKCIVLGVQYSDMLHRPFERANRKAYEEACKVGHSFKDFTPEGYDEIPAQHLSYMDDIVKDFREGNKAGIQLVKHHINKCENGEPYPPEVMRVLYSMEDEYDFYNPPKSKERKTEIIDGVEYEDVTEDWIEWIHNHSELFNNPKHNENA